MGEISRITQKTENRFLNFFELDTVKKTGQPGKYYLASRARCVDELELTRKETKADGVAMYVICGAERDRVLLIRQFRWAVGQYVYEFPAGLVEPGEDYHEAAVREVYEETGLRLTPLAADSMFERPYYMTDGMTDEACALVYGYAEGDVRDQHLEDSEEIEVILADRDEVRRILKEERAAVNCAIHLMHFLYDTEPFGFLNINERG
ncbi:MAG: NUDIX hydrolase [Lachnospiraceae bacterium]|nr:NUDIX hydrolase [Lachnospiraceae bacterium]